MDLYVFALLKRYVDERVASSGGGNSVGITSVDLTSYGAIVADEENVITDETLHAKLDEALDSGNPFVQVKGMVDGGAAEFILSRVSQETAISEDMTVETKGFGGVFNSYFVTISRFPAGVLGDTEAWLVAVSSAT